MLFKADKKKDFYPRRHQRIRLITKLPNSEQSYKGKVKTHNYINRQNQSTTGKLSEYGTALTTILPILFLYLNTVIVTAGTFEP
jgi:hypothetical protein